MRSFTYKYPRSSKSDPAWERKDIFTISWSRKELFNYYNNKIIPPEKKETPIPNKARTVSYLSPFKLKY